MINLPYFKIDNTVADPIRKTPGSACFDLAVSLREGFKLKSWDGRSLLIKDEIAIINENHIKNGLLLEPNISYLIPTGIAFDIPEGYHIQIHLRSSTGLKKHLSIPSHIGIIDSDYVEEVHIPLFVSSRSVITVKNGDFLAQAMLVKNIEEVLSILPEKPSQKTTRVGGFGSTDVKAP